MKPLTLFIILAALAILFSGCSAVYTDKELGKAQTISYDSQIAYPDYRYAEKTPNTLEGIFAEDVMQGYSESFTEGFSKQEIDITSTGIESK
jgi:hypothetical protein